VIWIGVAAYFAVCLIGLALCLWDCGGDEWGDP
jgi:hypothetical protein